MVAASVRSHRDRRRARHSLKAQLSRGNATVDVAHPRNWTPAVSVRHDVAEEVVLVLPAGRDRNRCAAPRKRVIAVPTPVSKQPKRQPTRGEVYAPWRCVIDRFGGICPIARSKGLVNGPWRQTTANARWTRRGIAREDFGVEKQAGSGCHCPTEGWDRAGDRHVNWRRKALHCCAACSDWARSPHRPAPHASATGLPTWRPARTRPRTGCDLKVAGVDEDPGS